MMISSAEYRNKHLDNPAASLKLKPKQTTNGPMFVLNDADIRADAYLKASSYWFSLFVEAVGPTVRTCKFLELRPAAGQRESTA